MIRGFSTPIAAVAVATFALSATSARAATNTLDDVVVNGLRAADDYPTSHLIIATGSQMQCSSACSELLLSHDGGATWSRAEARNWPGGTTYPAIIGTGRVLIAAGTGGVWLSRDDGSTFSNVSDRDGAIDVVSAHGTAAIVISPTANHGAVVLTLPDGRETAVGLTGVTSSGAMVWWNSSYPDIPTAAPALVAAVNQRQGPPVLQLCASTSFACTSGGSFPPGSGVAGLQVSPHFAHDHTLFALTAKGLVESRDGGATLVPTPVAPESSGTVVNTVVGIALTPAFDAVTGAGDTLAAVDSVTRSGKSASTSAGLYRSSDGLGWRPLAESLTSRGVLTTLSITPDRRALAGRIDFTSRTAGVLCSANWNTWAPACPATASPASGSGRGEQSPPGRLADAGSTSQGAGVEIRSPSAAGTTDPATGPAAAVATRDRAGSGTARTAVAAAALLAASMLAACGMYRRRRIRGAAAAHPTRDRGIDAEANSRYPRRDMSCARSSSERSSR